MKKVITLIKIICLLYLNFLVFYLDNLLFLIILLLIAIFIGLYLNKQVISRIKNILPAVFFIILFQLIFNTSIPIDQRIIMGVSAGARLVIISISVLLFLAVTSLSEIARFFSFLPRNILLILMMTLYFIPGLFKEAERIKAVQRSRGLQANNWNFINGTAALVVPLLHRVFQRAEILAYTLSARGYEE